MKISEIKLSIPECISFLVQGTEKTALIDCGLAFNAKEMAESIKTELNGRSLDYVIPTHSHYDHVGGIPYFRSAFPGVKVVSSAKTAKVFSSDGAKALMRKLNEGTGFIYTGKPLGPDYDESKLYVDIIAEEGDVIDLGDCSIHPIHSPGHTSCSYSMWIPEMDAIVLAESVGVYPSVSRPCTNHIAVDVLVSYKDCVESVKKIRDMKVGTLYSLHYGLIKDFSPDEFFGLVLKAIESDKDLILDSIRSGMTDEEVLEECRKTRYKAGVVDPGAYQANFTAYIKTIHKEFNV